MHCAVRLCKVHAVRTCAQCSLCRVLSDDSIVQCSSVQCMGLSRSPLHYCTAEGSRPTPATVHNTYNAASQYRDQVSAPNTFLPNGSGANPPSKSSSFGNNARYLQPPKPGTQEAHAAATGCVRKEGDRRGGRFDWKLERHLSSSEWFIHWHAHTHLHAHTRAHGRREKEGGSQLF